MNEYIVRYMVRPVEAIGIGYPFTDYVMGNSEEEALQNFRNKWGDKYEFFYHTLLVQTDKYPALPRLTLCTENDMKILIADSNDDLARQIELLRPKQE